MGGVRQQINKKYRYKYNKHEFVALSEEFLSIKTTQALALLLNISDQAYISLLTNRYEHFSILKKNGSKRLITKPNLDILGLQRKLNLYLQSVYYRILPVNIFGNIPNLIDSDNRNARSNAALHCGKNFILNIDIKDFFPSIDTDKVRKVFNTYPFNFSDEVTELICQIVTYNDSLPTGASTSSIISNFVLNNLDDELHYLGKCNDGVFSRYIDDITFSFNEKPGSEFLKKVLVLLENNGFAVSWDKFMLRGKNQRQVVNGIVVNDFPNIKSEYYKELRAILHNLKYKNYDEEVQKYINSNYKSYCNSIRNYWIWYFKKSDIDVEISDEVLVKLLDDTSAKYWYTNKSIQGKLSYVGDTLGKSHPKYIRLCDQYKALFTLENRFLNLQPNPDLVFVTNATSKSIVYYAYSFLKHAGYNFEKLNSIIRNLQLGEISNWKEIQRKLQNSFINHSVYFLSLYQLMQETKDLGSAISNSYEVKDWKSLIDNLNEGLYQRRVFHPNPSCSYLRSDYEEETVHKNTGVFGEIDSIINTKFYLVDKGYLINLGMRTCKICG
jgi:RNA-directed DNA polymerase